MSEKSIQSLGDRMKCYEASTSSMLEKNVPVIIRVDGKAFHSYLKKIESFNECVNDVMDKVAVALCENIQGAQVAYVQSDEVSVFVHSYKNENSSSWFNNQQQKMCSVAAAIAAATFTAESWKIWTKITPGLNDIRPAYFDARVFTLPEYEVCNYFIWRQKDAIRNSVQTLARTKFSHKKVDGKNQLEMKEMCRAVGSDWDELPVSLQHGRAVYRVLDEKEPGVIRSRWHVDKVIPLFTADRDFIERFLKRNEENDECEACS